LRVGLRFAMPMAPLCIVWPIDNSDTSLDGFVLSCESLVTKNHLLLIADR
jgi:hypothetical protein